jgi:hypothetical protein
MKTKKYILTSILLFGINFICAQTQEDLQKLSIFSEYVKAKKL